MLQNIPCKATICPICPFVQYSHCASKFGDIWIQKQSTIRSGVFNQLFIQYFNDQSAWGDQRQGLSSTAFAR